MKVCQVCNNPVNNHNYCFECKEDVETIDVPMTRELVKIWFKSDVDSYGKPKRLMSKLDMIFDELE